MGQIAARICYTKQSVSPFDLSGVRGSSKLAAYFGLGKALGSCREADVESALSATVIIRLWQGVVDCVVIRTCTFSFHAARVLTEGSSSMPTQH